MMLHRFLFRRLVSPVSDNAIKELLTAVTGKVRSSYVFKSSTFEEIVNLLVM